MTLSLIKPGGWAFGEILDEDQMNDLQDELIKAIDGVNGGSYTLGGTLTIGGANVHFTGNVFVDDDLLLGNGGSTQVTAGHTVHIQAIEDLLVDSESVTMAIPLSWGAPDGTTNPSWLLRDSGAAVPFTGWENLVTGGFVVFSLPVIAGDVITSIVVDVIGGSFAGHGGVDPGVKLKVLLMKQPNPITGPATVVASLVDPATGAAYDARHTVTLSPAHTAVDAQYFVYVQGEHGGTAANNENAVERVRAVVTRKSLISRTTFGA